MRTPRGTVRRAAAFAPTRDRSSSRPDRGARAPGPCLRGASGCAGGRPRRSPRSHAAAARPRRRRVPRSASTSVADECGRAGGRRGVARPRRAACGPRRAIESISVRAGGDQRLAVGVRPGDVAADGARRDLESLGELAGGRPFAVFGEDLDESLPLLGQHCSRVAARATRRRAVQQVNHPPSSVRRPIGTEFPGVRKPIWWSPAPAEEQNHRKRLRLRPTRSTTTGLPVARRHGRCASSWSAAPAPRARSSPIASVAPPPPAGSRCARRPRARRASTRCSAGADVLLVGEHLAEQLAALRERAEAASVPIVILPSGASSAPDGEEALDLALATAGAGS